MTKNMQPHRAILLAPFLFIVHVVEEAPGFVVWFNTLVADGITQELFLTVNGFGLVIMLAVTAFMASAKTNSAILLALTWLSFVMLANGLLHLTATLVHGLYSPGGVTSVVLYWPYYGWLVWLVLQRTKVSRVGLAAAVLVGATPMLVHGYLIVFEGSRLF